MAQFVLAWFVLFVSASVASPLIKPVDLQLVCSALGASRWVDREALGSEARDTPGSTLDCPVCLPGLMPSPAPVPAWALRGLGSALVLPAPPGLWAGARPTPFAARAPPVLS